MKHTITAAILMSLMASSLVMADSSKGRGHDDGENRYSHDSRWDDRRDNRWDRRDERRDDRWNRRDDRRDYRHDRARSGEYHHPRGYRPHYWRRGDRLPAAYYARPYVIRDYRGCHLRSPPRGAHWVRVNDDVVLAAIATGIVLDILYNHFY